jgi:hypothetical protein
MLLIKLTLLATLLANSSCEESTSADTAAASTAANPAAEPAGSAATAPGGSAATATGDTASAPDQAAALPGDTAAPPDDSGQAGAEQTQGASAAAESGAAANTKGKDLGKGWAAGNGGSTPPVEVTLVLKGIKMTNPATMTMKGVLELINDTKSPVVLTQGARKRDKKVEGAPGQSARSEGVTVGQRGDITIAPDGRLAALCPLQQDKSTRAQPLHCDLFPEAR